MSREINKLRTKLTRENLDQVSMNRQLRGIIPAPEVLNLLAFAYELTSGPL